MSRQMWANPSPAGGAYTRSGNNYRDVVFVDSRSSPTSSPAPAPGTSGNLRGIVPQGWVQQIGADGEVDTMLFDVRAGTSSISAYLAAVVNDNPFAYWRLDEATGTLLQDRTVHRYTVTSRGTGVTLNQSGAIADGDAAVAFDGAAGALDGGAASSGLIHLFQGGSWSVECWVNPVATANFFFDCGLQNNAGADNFLHVGFDTANHLKLGFFGDDLSGTTVVTTGNWHHVVATFSPVSRLQQLYLDGNPEVSRTASGILNVPTNAIIEVAVALFGPGNGPFFYNGKVDELAIYDGVLSAAQVKAHFQAAATASLSVPRSDANITQFVVPYFSGGWPSDVQAGQPGHTPQRPTGAG